MIVTEDRLGKRLQPRSTSLLTTVIFNLNVSKAMRRSDENLDRGPVSQDSKAFGYFKADRK